MLFLYESNCRGCKINIYFILYKKITMLSKFIKMKNQIILSQEQYLTNDRHKDLKWWNECHNCLQALNVFTKQYL